MAISISIERSGEATRYSPEFDLDVFGVESEEYRTAAEGDKTSRVG